MSLSYVTLTELAEDGSQATLNGEAVFSPNQAVYYSGAPLLVADVQVVAQVINGQLKTQSGGALTLLATDNAGLTFLSLTGFLLWTVQLTVGGVAQEPWSFFLPSAPSSRDLYSLASTGAGGIAYVPLAGGTMTGALSVPDLVVQGLTGATAASRYAGATASGAPASGTFITGDFVVDQAGKIWICTTAGSPGTWTAAGPTIPVPIAQGGTGQTAQQAAINALTGTQAAGKYLRSDGTNAALANIQAADVPTLNQNTTGNAATATNLAGGATLPAYVAPKVTLLTDAASVAVNTSSGNDFRLTFTSGVGSSRTIAAPSNPADGEKITFELIQAASGGPYTVTWASGAGGYDFGATGTPTLSTAASAIDQVAFRYSSSKGEWLCLGSALGF